MNELKPEDVMRALEWCSELRLCVDCPMRAEGYFSHSGNACRHALMKAALALLREKDAEIERLNKEVDRLSQVVLYHDGQTEDLVKAYQADVKMEIADARAEAITEFSERMEKSLTAQVNVSSNEMLAAFMWCLDLVKNVEKQLKGETDGKSDL
jgi:hypothetical protein